MIAQFAWRLICGMSLMWALMPRKQVTSGFFRIQMLVVMGLGVLAAMSDAMDAQSMIREAGSTVSAANIPSPFAASLPASITAFTGFLGSAFWTLERRTGATRIGLGILLTSVCWIWMLCSSGAGHDGYMLYIKRQQVLAIHELHVLCGHAVEAANVAAVGHADSQIVVDSAEGIDQRFGHDIQSEISILRFCAVGLDARMNPFGGTVAPVFFFPNRNDLFQSVDQISSRVKRLMAVRATDGDRHADIAQL